jgi:hypothetical protein
LTIQQLSDEHLNFLQEFKDDVSKFNAKVFLSLQILGYVIFYKYYLTEQKPKLSDYGDIFHLQAMPYCKLVVVERNMCEVLNQIKRNSNILKGVVIKNIKFLDDWQWIEEN